MTCYSLLPILDYSLPSAIKLLKNDLGDLLSKLYPVRAKWYNLGLALHIHPDDLDAIRSQISSSHDDCLREMLKLWLSTNREKGDLIKALKESSVGHHQLANELLEWVPSSSVLDSQTSTSCVQPILKQPEVSPTHNAQVS